MEEKKIVQPVFARHHKDLLVYQKSYALALDIHKLSLGFPKIEQFALANQLRRSSKSVPANIVEGFARQRGSKPEWKRYLMIAIGSAEETSMWIEFAHDLQYIDRLQYEALQDTVGQVTRMLHKLRNES